MTDFKEILQSLGYSNLIDTGPFYRTAAFYRGGDNGTSLSINKKTGRYVDFVLNKTGSFEELIALTLKLKDINQVKELLKNKYSFENIQPEEKIKLDVPKIFSPEILCQLQPNHEYFLNRGISLKTLQEFRGGVMEEGKMKGRYCFPIFNGQNQIIGISGRDITNKKSFKWKHLGQKSSFRYPLFLNHKIIQEKSEVILIESIANAMSLYDCGIKNIIVTFGTEISLSILNLLLKYNLKRIIISFDNDENGVGQKMTEKATNKLLRYFGTHQIRSIFPPNPFKDWNEVLMAGGEIKI